MKTKLTGKIRKLRPDEKPDHNGIDHSTIWIVTRTARNNRDVFVGSFPSSHEAWGYIEECIPRRDQATYNVEGAHPSYILSPLR